MGITVSQPSNKSMIDELVDKHHYIISPTVEGAFRAVDRALYFNLEEGDTFDPYSETPWRDGNIHLSAPCIYAKAVEALDLQPGHSFLNLGSGTGYLNTIVGLIIGPHGINHGIEYHLDVVDYARKRLERFKRESFAIDKYDFAEPLFVHGDCVKLNPSSRYDRVYLGAACSPELESFMKKLIKPAGGVLVMPLDNFLLRYIRITDVDWKVEKLMQVSFTLMIREPRESDSDIKMIDMPLAQPKSLKELCQIRTRQYIRDKINQENPNLLNSDNIQARKIRKAQAERKMFLKQEREFRRNYNVCPYVPEECETNGGGPGGAGSHKACRRWPCREFNSLGLKPNGQDDERIMTRSARRRFELARLFNHFRSSPAPSISTNNSASVGGHWRRRGGDQNDTGSDSSSSDSRSTTLGGDRGNSSSGSVLRGEGCSRTRPFVNRLSRQHSLRERASSPTQLGEPYRKTRSAFPASRRADIHRINSYRPVLMSSPSTASTNSDSSSSRSMIQNEEENNASGAGGGRRRRHRQPLAADIPSISRMRRQALSDLASRALISSIFEPIPNPLEELDVEDSDYEEESDDGDSFDDDFNDPDLSGLESCEEDEDISDEESDEEVGEIREEEEEDDQDDDDDNDDGDEDEDDDDEHDGDYEEDNRRRRYSDVRPSSRVLGGYSPRSDNLVLHRLDQTVSSRQISVGSSSSSKPVVTATTSSSASAASPLRQLSRDHRSHHEHESNQSSSNSSSMVATTSRYHHCHMQELSERKRKRHSSSSSCSEASNPSTPSKRPSDDMTRLQQREQPQQQQYQEQEQEEREKCGSCCRCKTKQKRKRKKKKKRKDQRRSANECQRYHNHMSGYISQLPVPQVLKNYLNFDRENIFEKEKI